MLSEADQIEAIRLINRLQAEVAELRAQLAAANEAALATDLGYTSPPSGHTSPLSTGLCVVEGSSCAIRAKRQWAT